MPKQPVTDPITDQEIVFARLVLAGSMTDRQAAEAAGLNPDTAAYTKAKPRVRDWMREHRAAVQQQLVRDEADEQLRRNQNRERVLARLWEIADLDPQTTRGSISAQVKALSMIVAIEGLIPDRRAAAPQNKPAPAPTPDFYRAAWLGQQPEQTTEPAPPPGEEQTAAEPQPVPPSTQIAHPAPPAAAAAPSPSPSAPLTSWVPRAPGADFVPDIRIALGRENRRL